MNLEQWLHLRREGRVALLPLGSMCCFDNQYFFDSNLEDLCFGNGDSCSSDGNAYGNGDAYQCGGGDGDGSGYITGDGVGSGYAGRLDGSGHGAGWPESDVTPRSIIQRDTRN